MKSNLFNFEVTEDCEQALKELQTLAVFKYRNNDQEDTFADVWWHIQHECDMYEEGESGNCLNSRSYKSARNWLEKHKNLYLKYNTK